MGANLRPPISKRKAGNCSKYKYRQNQMRMTSPETCERKQKYRDRAHAVSVLRRLSDSHVHPYRCPFGNHWHLGHVTPTGPYA